LYFALGLVSGPLADRFGARLLAVAGMILTGLGLAVASLARSLPEVYAAYGLGVGLGIGFSYVPILGAVQRWFVRRRGLASGLAVSGIGVGTLVMPPAAALLIDAMGWRGAYLVLGIFAAIVGGGMARWSRTIRAVAARGPTAIRRFSMRNHHTPPRPASATRYDRGGSSGFAPRACSARSGCSCRSFTSCPTPSITASRNLRPFS